MTKEEAIKYLQQIYPNGGHCWLDEQRIEAIEMAIKALKGKPTSEDLENAITDYFGKVEVIDFKVSEHEWNGDVLIPIKDLRIGDKVKVVIIKEE